MSRPGFSRLLRFALAVTIALVGSQVVEGQGTFLPVPGCVDIVFDHAGKYIYFATYVDPHSIRRYDIATGQLQTILFRNDTVGFDISDNDSYLLTAPRYAGGVFQKLDLATGAITKIPFESEYPHCCYWSANDVRIANNGLAFATTQGDADPVTEHIGAVFEIDLATNMARPRTDAPEVPEWTEIHRSADGSVLYFVGQDFGNNTTTIFTYSAATNTFSAPAKVHRITSGGSSAALSRNGTRAITQIGTNASLDSIPGLNWLHSFKGLDGGVAFDAVRDAFYAVQVSTGQIIAYDSNSFAELFRLPIGENVEAGGFSLLVPSRDGRYLALRTTTGVRLFNLPLNVPQPTPTPAPPLTARRDMVFDHTDTFLYVTTATGLVERYNVSTGQIDRVYGLGGTLNGIDIGSDDSYVLVAQGIAGVREGVVQKIDVNSGAVTNITYPRTEFEDAPWDVAIASNGRAFATTDAAGSVWAPLRQINLATNAVTMRQDTPMARNGPSGLIGKATQIHRSSNGNRLYLLGNPLFTYDAGTDHFGPVGQPEDSGDRSSGAVNRDGTVLATRIGSSFTLDTAPELRFKRSFDAAHTDSGIVFDPLGDAVYAVSSKTNEIIAYDTVNFCEKARAGIKQAMVPASGQFDTGNLVAGYRHLLALATPSGIELFDVKKFTPTPPLAPIFDSPGDFVFDHAGNYLYIATLNGLVWPYNVATDTLEAPYEVGGLLNGIDIAPDDSFLIVAQDRYGIAEGMFQKVDLNTRSVTNFNYSRIFGEAGGWDVAIDSKNRALITTAARPRFTAFNPLRQINLATNDIEIRADVPGTGKGHELLSPAQLHRSANRNRTLVVEHAESMFSYDAVADGFGPARKVDYFPDYSSFAVNRDGSMAALRVDSGAASVNNLPDFSLRHAFQFYTVLNGVAFDPTRDIFYGIDTLHDQIVGYDTAGFADKFHIDIGEDVDWWSLQFGPGTMAASPDGRYLALSTVSALRIYDIAANSVPTITSCTVLVDIEPDNGGTVQGGGIYTPGHTVLLIARPNRGYSFAGWTENGAVISTADTYSFIATSDHTFEANFVAIPNITISAAPTTVRKGGAATFTFSATTINPLAPVTVNYRVAGNAALGTDYTLDGAPNQITIPAGQASVTRALRVVTTKTKGKEKVTLQLATGSQYNLPSGKNAKRRTQATVTIQNR